MSAPFRDRLLRGERLVGTLLSLPSPELARWLTLPPPEEPYTTIISRAFRRLEPLMEMVSPLIAPGCTLIAMLGPTRAPKHRLFSELASAHGLKLSQIVPLELPRGRGGRTLAFFRRG